jgi:hypothetical protein
MLILQSGVNNSVGDAVGMLNDRRKKESKLGFVVEVEEREVATINSR